MRQRNGRRHGYRTGTYVRLIEQAEFETRIAGLDVHLVDHRIRRTEGIESDARRCLVVIVAVVVLEAEMIVGENA